MDETGRILKSVSREYKLSFPHPGWAEQNPEDYWYAVLDGLADLTAGYDTEQISGVGCGGQMHGLVVLDSQDRIIRPAILWNDGRTAEETDYLNNVIGKKRLSKLTANVAFAGFTAPKLLWMKTHEPENFARIAKIMLPKDYINYKLTGVHSCDYSDASGMLLLDVANKCWSKEMMEICGVTKLQMPKLFESYEVIGNVISDIGLPKTVKVVAGAGDNAAAAVGTGTVGDGACNISLGTSGTIFISSDSFKADSNNALHAFAHADGHYHLMGCILSAASCNRWLCEDILHNKDFAAEQSVLTDDMLGRNRVFFLPYLMGERSPINDTDARGTFIGMSMDTTRADMVQAMLEGVAFAFRDSLEVAGSLGINVRKSKFCGGGAKSPIWGKIIANVLNVELEIPQTEEGPGYGSAMLAMVGTGRYPSVETCVKALVRTTKTVSPDLQITARYENKYKQFKKIYPTIKPVFKIIKED